MQDNNNGKVKQAEGKKLRVVAILLVPALMAVLVYLTVTGVALLIQGLGLPKIIAFSYAATFAYVVGVKKVVTAIKELLKKALTALTTDSAEEAESK